jgi:hypothetical protein
MLAERFLYYLIEEKNPAVLSATIGKKAEVEFHVPL